MDRKVVEVSSLSLSFSLFLWLSPYLPTYVCIYLSIDLYIYLSLSFSSNYLDIYIPIYLSTYLPIYLSTYLPTYLPTYLSIYLSLYLYLYLYLSISLSLSLSLICLSNYLSVCLSVCLSICKLENKAILRDFLTFRSWQHQKRNNSARLPHFSKLTASKTKQFCDTSSFFEIDNIKNGNATKPSRFAHFWQGAQSLAPATRNDIWTSKSSPNPWCFMCF